MHRIIFILFVLGTTGFAQQLSTPTEFSGNAPAGGNVQLKWRDSANEMGYVIERRKSGTPDFAVIAELPANITAYEDKQTSAPAKFHYRVRAKLGNAFSEYSTVATVTTIPLPPAAPAGLVATPVSSTNIHLTWKDEAKNESGFKLERSINGGAYKLVKALDRNQTAYQDYDMPAGSAVKYRLRATNTGGDSPALEMESFTYKDNGPGATWTIRRGLSLGHLETIALAPVWQPDGTVRIKDVSNIPVPEGYGLRYYVNEVLVDGELVKQGPFQPGSNISIAKVISRGRDLWNWQNGKNDYILAERCGLSEIFTGYAPGRGPSKPGTGSLRRLKMTTAYSTDWAPVKEKTANLLKFKATTRKLGVTLRTGGMEWSDLQKRGFQYVGGAGAKIPVEYTLNTPGTHQTGPHTEKLKKSVAQWTKEECISFGKNEFGVVGLTADQLNEGYSPAEIAGIVHTQSDKYAWIYEGAMARAREIKPTPILIGSYESKYRPYFRPGGGAWDPFTAAGKDSLESPAKARKGLWWFDLDVSHNIMPIHQVYPTGHDREGLYTQPYGIQRLQKASEGWGKDGRVIAPWSYLWPMIAGSGYNDTLFKFERERPTEKVYSQTTAALSYNAVTTICLNTFILAGPGGGVYTWEDGTPYWDESDPRITNETKGESWETPKRPFAIIGRTQGIYSAPIGAAEIYGELVAAGGERFQFAKFKVGKGDWVEPAPSGNTILAAAEKLIGWCVVSQKDRGYAVYYSNPSAPVTGETVTVDLGSGRTVTFDCYDNEPVAIAGIHPGGTVTLQRAQAW